MKALSIALAALLPTSAAAIAQTTANPTSEPTVTTDGQFYKRQGGDRRASKVIGKKVVDAANQTVGEINDVLIGKDGKPAAAIVGVGGFLGFGEREIAVNYDALQFSKDAKGHTVVTLNMTKEQIDRAPAWKRGPAAKTDAGQPQ